MSTCISCIPEEIVQKIVLPESLDLFPELSKEFSDLQKDLDQRSVSVSRRYPTYFGITATTAALVYFLIRLMRPRLIVETGVADGVSTYVMLHGLKKNRVGRLISFDVTSDVGALLTPAEKEGWTLQILPSNRSGKLTSDAIKRLNNIDMFLHDSYHWYVTQKSELRAAWTRLARNGTLLCDDADASYALIDFSKSERVRPYTLVTERKVFGVILKSSSG